MTKTEKNREEKKRKVVMPAGIRNKMVAAVSMLLVASIMMVSSTYAWFTLSTAPEVTGITTNVGANGNLEMMLLNKDSFNSTEENLGVESGVNDSMAAQKVTLANLKWGNLVDLADQSYGLQSIVMNPARLNITEIKQENAASSYTLSSSLLKAPSYTSDGRVLDVDKDTLTSGYSTDDTWKWDEKADNAYGVRVIGTTSGVTERLTAYRAAISARAAAIESAKNHARNSLLNNGQTLANIVVKAALQDAPTFEKADLEALQELVAQLKTANDAAGEAIVQTVLAYNLSNVRDSSGNEDDKISDADVANLKKAFENKAANALPNTFTRAADESKTGTILTPSGTEAAVTKWSSNNDKITTAGNKIQELITANKPSYTNGEIMVVVNMLLDKSKATVAGVTNPGRTDADRIIENLTKNNMILEVEMNQDSGIYADIAELAGDYNASGLQIKVTVGSLGNISVTVNMSTSVVAKDTTGTLPMIPKLDVGSAPAATRDDSVKPLLTDHYGYALDFGFRTNAAASELQLQTDEIQRVYSGDGAAKADTTQGGGSYMEFRTSNIKNFSVDELRALMSALRVVFVEPVQTESAGVTTLTYNVLGVAAADITCDTKDQGATYTYEGGTLMKDGKALAENADATTANGLKAELQLYNYNVDKASGALTLNGKKTTGAAADAAADNKLTALTQNVAKKVTAIVYLDGDIVDNTMVANAANSMTGSLNLQFSSSATLKPMENTGMRDGGRTGTTTPVTYEEYKKEGASYEKTVGETTYTITVNQDYVIYQGSDDNYYYVYNNNGNYVRVTDNGILTCPAVTVSIKQVQPGN